MLLRVCLGGGVGLAAAAAAAAAARTTKFHQELAALPAQPIDLFDGKKSKRMAVVIGSGCAGVSSAFGLAQRGYDVVVLDAGGTAAAECSAVAAGGMQRSNPLIDRDHWKAVSKSILSPKSDEFKFFRINWWATCTDPHFWRWLANFSYFSLVAKQDRREQRNMLLFTLWAVEKLKALFEADGGQLGRLCGYGRGGALKLSYEPLPDHYRTKNCVEEEVILSNTEEVLAKEASLAPMAKMRPPVAAVFQPDAAMGSSEVFTKTLAERCERRFGVQFVFDTSVRSLELTGDGRGVCRLRTDRGVVEIDPQTTEVVVAAGSWTGPILWTASLFAPVYGLKGYSIELELPEELRAQSPHGIISDAFTYVSRLGENKLRMTAIGEFCGWNTEVDESIDRDFRAEVTRILPHFSSLARSAPTRCGLRPFVADGVVLIGRVDGVSNLSVNVGPGSNGWKICVGAGDVLARVLVGDEEQLGFDPRCLSPAGRIVRAPLWSRMSLARWGGLPGTSRQS